MEGRPQFSAIKNCTHFTTDELLSLNLSISITGGVCFIISLLIILLLICHKAYQTLLQRLFVYLMVATSLRELSLLSLIERYFHYKGQNEMCIVVAYFNHWTVAMALVFTMGILVYMLYLVRRIYKGHTLTAASQSESTCFKYCRYILEILYVILVVELTFVYGAEPYMRHKYGLAGAWCWIVSLDENCKRTNSGLVEQVTSYVFILTVGLIGVILMIFTAITYCRMQSTAREVKQLLRKTFVILACLLLFVAFHVITLSVRIFSTKHKQYQHFSLWIVHAMAQSISFLLFPFGFILCFHTTGVIETCRRLCHRLNIAIPHEGRRGRQQYIPLSTVGALTAPESTHEHQPSITMSFVHVSTPTVIPVTSEQDGSTEPKRQTDSG